jgi:alpha-1,6-mannosyltransferase
VGGWIGAVTADRTIETSLSISTTLGLGLADAMAWFSPGVDRIIVVEIVRRIALALAAALVTFWFLRERRYGLDALGWSLVALALLSPAMQPWYLMWGLGIVVCAAGGRRLDWLVGLSILVMWMALPVGPRFDRVLFGDHAILVTAAAALILAPVALPLPRRRRQPQRLAIA